MFPEFIIRNAAWNAEWNPDIYFITLKQELQDTKVISKSLSPSIDLFLKEALIKRTAAYDIIQT